MPTVNLATAEEFHAEIARLQAEIVRLRLADDEREAVKVAANFYADWGPEWADRAAALSRLMERMAR